MNPQPQTPLELARLAGEWAAILERLAGSKEEAQNPYGLGIDPELERAWREGYEEKGAIKYESP